jgi:sec-independent protein translocase protein TatA
MTALGLPGSGEWLLIFLVVLLLFGSTKIPQLMRGLGAGIGEFKKGLKEGERPEPEKADSAAEPKDAPQAKREAEPPG